MATDAEKKAKKAYRQREREAGRFKRVTVEYQGAQGLADYSRLKEAAEAEGLQPAAYVRRLIVEALG